jgi:hypothetical protein
MERMGRRQPEDCSWDQGSGGVLKVHPDSIIWGFAVRRGCTAKSNVEG